MGRILAGVVGMAICLGAFAGDHSTQDQKGAPKRATASSADRFFNFENTAEWTAEACTADGCTYKSRLGELFKDDHKGTITNVMTGEVFKQVNGKEYRSQGKPTNKVLFAEMPKGKPSAPSPGQTDAKVPSKEASSAQPAPNPAEPALPAMLALPGVKEFAEKQHPIGTVVAVKWSMRGCPPCKALESTLEAIEAKDPKFKHITLNIGATANIPAKERTRTPEEEINLASAGKMWPEAKSYQVPMTYMYVMTADGWKTYGEGVEHSFTNAPASSQIEAKIAGQRAPLSGGREIAVQPRKR